MRKRNRSRSRDKQPILGAAPAAPISDQRTPLPGALDGEPWHVKANRGPLDRAFVAVTPKNRLMSVPVGAEERERRVRLHEMGHARWTRFDTKTPASPASMQAAEDGRVHKRLHELGYADTLNTPLFGPEELQRFDNAFILAGQCARGERERGPLDLTPADVARILSASLRTAEWGPLHAAAYNAGLGWVSDYVRDLDREHLAKRRPAWKDSVAFAQGLDRLDEMPDATNAGGDADGEKDHLLRELADEYGEPDGSLPRWGEMEMVYPPLTERIPPGLQTRIRRASDMGAVPRNWHRLNTDGRVFSRNRRRPSGGAVLIDQSGSMALEPSEVTEIIARYPGVVVATYSGDHHSGELRIIARNGKRASEEDCYSPMGGNCVDGPALQWLNEQPGPRVWVSDGHVFGRGDSDPATCLADARRLVREGDVTHVTNIRDLIGYERGE